MSFFRRWLLIFCAFIWGGTSLFAASTKEERAYAAATAAFHDEMWQRASTEFAAYVQNFPDSPKIPMAVLLQAQAEFKQRNFDNAIALLDAHFAQAKNLADQYVDWKGEAQFAGSNYPAAAETFTTLATDFTNSVLQLSATVNAADARAQLGQWAQVENLLETPDGIFQKMLRLDTGSELILRGQLLRAQAKAAQKDFAGALAILASKSADSLPPGLDWPWAYLISQNELAMNDLPKTLATSTNLLQVARNSGNKNWIAESVSFHASLLEKMQLNDDALTAYQENLMDTNAPVASRQQAIFKIAEMAAAQKKFGAAELLLGNLLAQFPDAPAADVALLAIGELRLKDFAAQGAATNLPQAKANFDQFIGAETNSIYLGKAYLDRGWCNWFATNFAASAADFSQAVKMLPRSVDQAVAYFKLGDALLEQNDFSGALENYRAVVDDFSDFPAVGQGLGERALYQSLRASEAMNDYPSSTNALAQILQRYPEGDLSDNAILLFGENVAESGRRDAAQKARELFRQFIQQFPRSELLPQAELAIARSYEQQSDWPAAITDYQNWLKDFPASELRPQVIYALALANYQAGNETNALAQLTQFITQFPTDTLAPQAQWWIADSFFRDNNFAGAETNYENIYQNPVWKNSQLFYPAQFMAGRAAMGRQGYSDAIGYFTKLISDTNCPSPLDVQARFACAAAEMQTPSTDTNNPFGNFSAAIGFLNQIIQKNPTNDAAARAWGEIGKCDLQMNNFSAATNAFSQVFAVGAPAFLAADISARSQAQIGLGLVLEKLAQSSTGNDQTNLLNQALQNYSDVLYQNNLRDGERADPRWLKKSGLQAAAVAQSLGQTRQAIKIYQRLEELLPPLKPALDKKITDASAK